MPRANVLPCPPSWSRQALLWCLVSMPCAVAAAELRPAAPERDTSGKPVHAHAACIIKVGDTFYRYGEGERSAGCGFGCFTAATCYTSKGFERWTFANNVLQLKADAAGRSATRLIINTMFTAGLFDLAAAKGIPQIPEDFGQTLGHWGAGPGPYLVIPVLGPSNVRDATGIAADATFLWAITPAVVYDSYLLTGLRYGLQAIDTRHRTAFRYFETGSPFEYDLVRLIYTEKRKLDIAH